MIQLLEAARLIAIQIAIFKGDVAAQALLQPKQLHCIAQTAFGEARGEGADGMALVVQSMVNRHTIKGRSGCKIAHRSYDGFRRWQGRSPRKVNPESWRQAELISIAVIMGEYDLGDCSTITHFLNPRHVARMPRWASPANEVCRVGNHVGYHVAKL